VGLKDWAYTYDHLDSETQSKFTEDEWSRKNQWFADNSPAVYHVLSVGSDSASQEPVAEVEADVDGSSSTRNTYFVVEDGEWKHRFSEEETELFMPRVAFEEFVEAR
jgi:hypothetical protein